MSEIVAVGLNRKHPRWKHALEFFGDMLVDGMIVCGHKTGAERASADELEDLHEKISRNPDGITIAFDLSSGRSRGIVLATVEFEDADAPTLVVHAAAACGMWKDPDAIEKAGEWCRPLYEELQIFARDEGCASIVFRGHPAWAEYFPSRMLADVEHASGDIIH